MKNGRFHHEDKEKAVRSQMKAVCFGEIMLRLNPEGYLLFPQATKFEASYGCNASGRVQR